MACLKLPAYVVHCSPLNSWLGTLPAFTSILHLNRPLHAPKYVLFFIYCLSPVVPHSPTHPPPAPFLPPGKCTFNQWINWLTTGVDNFDSILSLIKSTTFHWLINQFNVTPGVCQDNVGMNLPAATDMLSEL